MSRKTKSNLKLCIPGIVVFAILVGIMSWFVIHLFNTGLVPEKYLLILAGVMYVLAMVVFFLMLNPKRKGTFITGAVLTVVMVAGMIFANGYIKKGVETLENITKVETALVDMGIYVRAEDSALDIMDVTDYTFGIMGTIDRENTNVMLENMAENMGKTPATQEYEGVFELVDALLTTREVNAIVVNSAFLALFDDMEGYEDVLNQIHPILSEHIEVPVDTSNQEDDFTEPGQILETEQNATNNKTVFSIYLSGIDAVGKVSVRSRSDVNIIATVNTETRQILLTSTPRDAYVTHPASYGLPDKLTNAGIYGIDCSIGALENVFKTDIDYYFRVNFSGFEDIIDALGGVTVYSAKSFSAPSGEYFRQGENKVNGKEALVFVRQRKVFADGDHQRGRNQMAMIEAVINKAMSPALLTGYTDIMESVSDSFETNIPYDLIASLVKQQLEEGGSWNIQSCSVSGTGASKKPFSQKLNAYVMDIDYSTVDAAVAKMNQVKSGEILQ